MAPILRRKELLDEVEARVIKSVVIVKFFVRRSEVCATGKRKRQNQGMQLVASTHYRASTGFIVDSTAGGSAFVAVATCIIDPKRGDLVRVCFHGGTTRGAKVFLSTTASGHTILEVKNPPADCPAVSFHTGPYHRGDLFLLANVGDSGLNSYTSTVIHPDTTAYGPDAVRGFSKTKLKGSEKTFTFSLIASIEDLIGAAVFDMGGLVTGTVSHQDSRHIRKSPWHPSDIKYAHHACYFGTKLVEAIQMQKSKVEAGRAR